MSNMNYEEKLAELAVGTNWINGRNESIVTVLFITNENVSDKFAQANPPQVVFLTQKGSVVSVTVEKFIRAHEFYNVQTELVDILTQIQAGSWDDIKMSDDEDETVEDSSPEPVYTGTTRRDIDIRFMTIEDDPRRAPLMTEEYLKPLLQKVFAEPIVVSTPDGLAMAGTVYQLTFNNNDPDLEELINSSFDPDSVCQHYAGFTWNGELVEIDTVLGMTHSQTLGGKALVLHLATLGEVEDDVVEAEDEVQEAEPEAQKPKTFSDLAKELHAQRLAAENDTSDSQPTADTTLTVSVDETESQDATAEPLSAAQPLNVVVS